MASQSSQSYLVRLQVALEDDNAMSMFTGQMTKIQDQIQNTDNALESLTGSAQNLPSVFKGAPKRVNALTRAIRQSDMALEDLAATNLGGTISQGAQNATKNLAAFKQQAVQASSAQQKLGQSSSNVNNKFRKTSQTSQNLLRIVQDARFGMLGMANNIQALGESMGRASERGVGAMTQLKRGVMNLVTGPFAIPFAITLFTTLAQVDFSDLIEKLDGVVDSMQRLSDITTQSEEALYNLNSAIDDQFEQDLSDIVSAVGQIEDADLQSEALTMMGDRARSVSDEVQRLKNVLDEPYANRSFLLQQFEGRGIVDAMGQAQQRLEELQAQRDVSRRLQEAISDEATVTAERIETIQEELGFSNQKAVKFAQILQKAEENAKGTSEELEDIGPIEGLEGFDTDQLADEIFVSGATDPMEQVRREFDVKRGEVVEQFDQQMAELQTQLVEKREEIREEFEDAPERRRARLNALANRITAEKNQLKEERDVMLNLLTQREAQAFDEAVKEEFDRRAEEREEGLKDPPPGGYIFINGERVGYKAFKKRQKEQWSRMQDELQAEREQLDAEREIGEMKGIFEPIGQERIAFQLDMMEREEELIQKRIRKRQEHLGELYKAEKEAGNDQRAQQLFDQIASLEEKKFRIENKWYQKRQNRQERFIRERIMNLETSKMGDAVRGTIMRLGALWQGFHENQINWQEKSLTKRATLIGTMGGEVAGAAATVAQQTFKSWQSQRERELENMGKSEAEKRRILKEEGKKRFQIMKAIKITEASVNTATGVTRALAELPPPASYAAAAATAAAGLFRIKQIAGMSIGDRIGGGGGGGAGGAGPSSGKFTQLNRSMAARRAADAGTQQTRSRRSKRQEEMKNNAKEIGKEVAKRVPDEVGMDRRTAGEAVDEGQNINNKFQK